MLDFAHIELYNIVQRMKANPMLSITTVRFNPLMPRRTLVSPFTEISILF